MKAFVEHFVAVAVNAQSTVSGCYVRPVPLKPCKPLLERIHGLAKGYVRRTPAFTRAGTRVGNPASDNDHDAEKKYFGVQNLQSAHGDDVPPHSLQFPAVPARSLQIPGRPDLRLRRRFKVRPVSVATSAITRVGGLPLRARCVLDGGATSAPPAQAFSVCQNAARQPPLAPAPKACRVARCSSSLLLGSGCGGTLFKLAEASRWPG